MYTMDIGSLVSVKIVYLEKSDYNKYFSVKLETNLTSYIPGQQNMLYWRIIYSFVNLNFLLIV